MNSIRTCPFWTSTERMTPRSTSETTGISGIRDLLERLPDLGLGYHCAPAGAERRTIVISSQSGARSSVCVPRSTASTSARPTRCTSSPRSSCGQDSERVRPQLLDRRLEARLVAQPVVPHLGVHAVVRLLAVDLRREARDRRVGVVLERRDPDLVGDLVEPAARDRVRPVEQVELDERRAAVLLRLAVEGERVGVAVVADSSS